MKQAIAVAISGKGRTLSNLLKEQEHHAYRVAGVISSSPNCAGNTIAKEAGIPIFVGDFSKGLCADDLYTWLQQLHIQWIALAGFLKIFPLLPGFQNRIVNIHPALLPKFGGPGMYGMRVHQAVHQAMEQQSGATIHFVSEKYDEGPIIAQIPVNISGLSPEAIADKVFQAECQLYPKVLDGLIKGSLPLHDESAFLMKPSTKG
ncbi:MAG: phosphoribosylglycinamide formyltransferase [Oligoflexus sp.]